MDGKIKTDRGLVRSVNEDNGIVLINDHDQALAIVADGMGGHKAGEVASNLAVHIAEKEWERAKRFVTPVEAENWLQNLISIILVFPDVRLVLFQPLQEWVHLPVMLF